MTRITFQRAWDYKKKGKMDQRNKGFKQPFFRNNSQSYKQGKQAQNDVNMMDSLGKRSR
jgi:hypothetical protein